MPAAADQTSSDQRRAPRLALLIRPGKLITRQGEFLCVIRDLSETGLSVRLFHPLPLDKRLTVEFQTGDRHEIETVWQNEGAAGFRFTNVIDLARAVAATSDYPKRPLRLNLERRITVSTGVHRTNAILQNVSNQGARIECSSSVIAIGELIRIETSRQLSVRAKVRWRRANIYGVVFVDTFPLSDFARLTADLQLSGAETGSPTGTAA